MPRENGSLQSENCMKEETSLPVMVDVIPVSGESTAKEIDNEPQSENANSVNVGENHVEVSEENAEEKVQEEESESRKVVSSICNKESHVEVLEENVEEKVQEEENETRKVESSICNMEDVD